MMRLRNILLAAILILFGLIACGRRVDVDLSDRPQYAAMIGKHYKTKIEFAAVQRYRKGTLILQPFGGGILPERGEVKPPFPAKYSGKTIVGILPQGSVLKLVQVKEEGSSTMSGTYFITEITSSSDPDWIGKAVYAGLSDYEEIPRLDPKYVEELP